MAHSPHTAIYQRCGSDPGRGRSPKVKCGLSFSCPPACHKLRKYKNTGWSSAFFMPKEDLAKITSHPRGGWDIRTSDLKLWPHCPFPLGLKREPSGNRSLIHMCSVFHCSCSMIVVHNESREREKKT